MRLALEAAERLGIASDFVGEEFQSDEAVQPRVLGLVTGPAAATELLDDAVVGNGLADHFLVDRKAPVLRRFILRTRHRLVNECHLYVMPSLAGAPIPHRVAFVVAEHEGVGALYELAHRGLCLTRPAGLWNR